MGDTSEYYESRLKENKKIVRGLEESYRAIVVRGNSILEKLSKPEYIITLKEEKPSYKDIPDEIIQEQVSEAVLVLVGDALRVSEELHLFVSRIADGKKPKRTSTSFLWQVWSGEMYGETGFKSLEKLLQDMKGVEEILLLSEDKIVEHVRNLPKIKL